MTIGSIVGLDASFDTEIIQKKSINKNSSRPPTGITFSPTTITDGTGSVLTIEGSGFGATQGKVGFRNSDANGSPFFMFIVFLWLIFNYCNKKNSILCALSILTFQKNLKSKSSS